MSFQKDIARISRRIIKSFKDVEEQTDIKDISEESVRIVKTRTRLGYGVGKPGGKRSKLKKLSKKYKDQRKKNKGKLSNETTPSKSNLTRTGQLLNSLKAKLKSKTSFTIETGGKRRGGGPSNKEVTKHVQKDRPFLNLSNNEVKQIEQFTVDLLIKRVKKKLTDFK